MAESTETTLLILVGVVTALVGILTLLAAIFGIYIGLKDWKISEEYKKAKDTIVRLQEKFDILVQISSQFGITGIYLSHAMQFSQQVKTATVTDLTNILPVIRDVLTKALITLEPLKGQKLKYGRKECDTFREETLNIKLNLANVQYQGEVQDLIKKCDDIIKLINGFSFD